MHFFAIVMIPEITLVTEIALKAAQLLEPYDEAIRVEPYKKYLDEWDTGHIVKNAHGSDPVPFIEEWTGYPGGQDETGLFSWSIHNPKAKWDWWDFGGRWNGIVRGKYRGDTEGGYNFDVQYRQLEENMLHAARIDHELKPFAILTPQGEWHERGWMNTKQQNEWEEECISLFRDHRKHIYIGVDCHI